MNNCIVFAQENIESDNLSTLEMIDSNEECDNLENGQEDNNNQEVSEEQTKIEEKESENNKKEIIESKKDVVLTKTVDNVVITVSSKNSSLKKETQLNVKKVKKSKVLKTIEKSLEDNQEIDNVVAFDITLLVNGKEVQPDGNVNVTFSSHLFKENDNIEMKVTHISDDLKKSEDMKIKAENDTISMNTNHFSIYAIVELKEWMPQTIDKNNYQSMNSFNYDNISSPAFDFHIFAEDVKLNAHTNGNIAAENFDGTNQSFGTNQNKRHVLEYHYFGTSAKNVSNIASGIVVIGGNVSSSLINSNQVVIGDSSNPIASDSISLYKENKKYININQELNELRSLSIKLAKNNTSNGVIYTKGKDQNSKSIIDLTESQALVNFLNVKASDLMHGNHKTTLKIVGASNKTVIINIDMANANKNALENLVTVIDDYNNGEDVVKSNCNVLFNLYEKDGESIKTYQSNKYEKVGCSDYFMGTILAPDAYIQYGAVNGSIIARKVLQNGQESHSWLYTGLSASLKVNKTLIDKEANQNKTFYFGVFVKENNQYTKVPNQRIRSIELKNKETKSVIFSNLKTNMTYYVFETDQDGRINHSDYQVSGEGSVTITNTSDNQINIVNSKEKIATVSQTVIKNGKITIIY
jgi:hypothetical protein